MIMINIRFNSDNELLLNKTKEIPSMIIVVRAIFHILSTSFLDECLYKI